MLVLVSAFLLRFQSMPRPAPAWAVAGFRDMGRGRYGKAAGWIVADELEKSGIPLVLLPDVLRRVAPGISDRVPMSAGSLEVMSRALLTAPRFVATVATGEVVDYRIDPVPGGRRARIALRAVAYDVPSGFPVLGALVVGDSEVRRVKEKVDIVGEALRRAARLCARMLAAKNVRGTVLTTASAQYLINQGARAGFVPGARLVGTQGPLFVGIAHVGAVESDQAELVIDSENVPFRSGMTVRQISAVPPLPATGKALPRRGPPSSRSRLRR